MSKNISQLQVGDAVVLHLAEHQELAHVLQVLRYPFRDFDDPSRRFEISTYCGSQFQRLFDATTGQCCDGSGKRITVATPEEIERIPKENKARQDAAEAEADRRWRRRLAEWEAKVLAAETWYASLPAADQSHVRNIAHKFCVAIAEDGYSSAEVVNLGSPNAIDAAHERE